MKKILLTAIILFSLNVRANDYYDDYTYEEFQTIYNEIPVQSYYAYPDDPNFIPESEFMTMDDNFDYDEMIYQSQTEEKRMVPGVGFAERPTVICRDFNCTRLNDRITRTFLFNSLANILMMNAHSRLYICEADPFSRSCLQSGISAPVRAGIANAMVKVQKATISQVNLSRGLSRATATMNYEFLLNGIQRTCEPTLMDISVPNNSQATLTNREFSCNLTSNSMSNISLLFNIDYIDLDYGLIGGYYSMGIQGAAVGSASGYVVFKTEFTTSGSKFRAPITQALNDPEEGRRFQPGEYTVEPLDKED